MANYIHFKNTFSVLDKMRDNDTFRGFTKQEVAQHYILVDHIAQGKENNIPINRDLERAINDYCSQQKDRELFIGLGVAVVLFVCFGLLLAAMEHYDTHYRPIHGSPYNFIKNL